MKLFIFIFQDMCLSSVNIHADDMYISIIWYTIHRCVAKFHHANFYTFTPLTVTCLEII